MTLLSTASGEAISALDVVPFEARSRPDGRPWLFTNMVASLDGAAAVDGLSGPMGDDDDREMFRSLRAAADAILVGSGTVNAEGYRPPQGSPDVDAVRNQCGRPDRPVITIITASMSVDPSLPLFDDPTYRPLILTSERADAARREELSERADVVTLGVDRVDLGDALAHLASLGHRTILSEGGPSLNGQLIRDGLVDEWNLTLAPLLVGGNAPRPAHGPSGEDEPTGEGRALAEYELLRLWRGERALFSRWVTR